MVDDDGQVAMSPLVGDLVDPDPVQAVQPVDPAVDVGLDPGHDRSHRPPPHSHQLRDRRFRSAHGQPGHRLVKGPGMAGAVTSPRDLDDGRTVKRASDAARIRLKEDPDGPQIQSSPPAAAFPTVIPRTPPTAPPTPSNGSLPGPDRHHHSVGPVVEPHLFNHDSFHTQHALPYPRVPHPVLPPGSDLHTARNLRSRRGATAHHPITDPRKQPKSQPVAVSPLWDRTETPV